MNEIIFSDKHIYAHIDPEDLKNAPNRTNCITGINEEVISDGDNGLITTIWGPHEWESFHAKTFGYPVNPSHEKKIQFLRYFTSNGDVLPCIHCSKSYKRFISEGDTRLDMNTMASRETLTRWGHRLHNAVNKKLGVEYHETYEELCFKYESYRARCKKGLAGCTMPLSDKAISYRNASIHRAPIIDIKYCDVLSNHAKSLGLTNYDNHLKYYKSLIRNSDDWLARDRNARNIIDYMRKTGTSSLDNNLPSYHEMLLISMLCSTLDHNKLEEIYQNQSLVIDRKYCDILRDHAKSLGLNGYDENLNYYVSLSRDGSSKEWAKRNYEVKKFIKYMKDHKIESLDSNGLPSRYEMVLICMMGSNLSTTKLEEIYKSLKKDS
jgi:hypothetical protein